MLYKEGKEKVKFAMQVYLVVFMLAVDAVLSFVAAIETDERTNLVVDDYPLFCWPKAVK